MIPIMFLEDTAVLPGFGEQLLEAAKPMRRAAGAILFRSGQRPARIDRDQGTRWAWIGMLGAQARQQRARIERQSLKTIRERLEHLILSEGSGPAGYPIPGTKIQLAAELGVTPEALYRCLAALQAEGKLSIEAGRLAWRG